MCSSSQAQDNIPPSRQLAESGERLCPHSPHIPHSPQGPPPKWEARCGDILYERQGKFVFMIFFGTEFEFQIQYNIFHMVLIGFQVRLSLANMPYFGYFPL